VSLVSLQTDPIPGGSANPYDYCDQDPVNCYDLQGTSIFKSILKKATSAVKTVAKVAKAVVKIADVRQDYRNIKTSLNNAQQAVQQQTDVYNNFTGEPQQSSQ
jgi:hypothetical protein